MTPNRSGTVVFTANATAQNQALPLGGGLLVGLFNAGPQPCYVEFSNDANSVCAVPTANVGGGFPVGANLSMQQFMLRIDDTRIAFVSDGNSTLYVTRGKVM
jgi:hypothetical protein